MLVALQSKIKIGSFSFSGVHSLRVKRSLNTYVVEGEIKLPTRARLRSRKNPKQVKEVDTSKQFKEGDKVEIYTAYDGRYNKEFEGFVKRINTTVPMSIEVEGYIWQMRRNNVSKFWKSATVKEIMQEAIKDTDVVLEVADDMPVVNFLARDVTGAMVLENLIKKVSKGVLTAFFIEHNKLWIGLKYTNPLNDVRYQIGRNVIDDNQLVKRLASDTKVTVEFVHREKDGKRQRGKATNGVGKVKKVQVQAVQNPDWLKRLAGAKLEKETYDGLEGKLTTFLEPFAQPGDKAILLPDKFDRQGNNIIEAVEVFVSPSGGRRIIELGISV